MLKKLLLALTFVLFCQTVFAESCPSVSAIQNNLIAGWKAYDSVDGASLSSNRLINFKKEVSEFALAEWAVDSKTNTGEIHCYYRDQNGSDLEAYLEKTNLLPMNAANTWYDVSGFKHCAAGMEKCSFQSNKEEKQLATKKPQPQAHA